MRLSAVAVPPAVAAVAHGFSLFGGDAHAAIAKDSNLAVPGASPLEFCAADRNDDIATIDRVDLQPNPPRAGQSLTIEASGTVRERIEQGAFVKLSVKYGYIKLLNLNVDLCEQIKNINLTCPIDEGPLVISKAVELPNEIPPGKYVVNADVFTEAEAKHITCLNAEVTFSKPSSNGGAEL